MKKIVLLLIMAMSVFANPSFEEIFAKQNIVMLLIDPSDGKIVDANRKALEFYGYEKEEFMQKNIQDINSLTAQQVAHEMELAKEQNRDYFIFSHRLGSGESKKVEVRSTPYLFGDEVLLLSFVQDLSELRIEQDGLFHYQERLEEEIAKQTDALRKAHQKERIFSFAIVGLLVLLIGGLIFLVLRIKRAKEEIESEKIFQETLVDSMLNALIATDKDGVITRLNAQAQKLLGYSEDEVVGKETPAIFHDAKQMRQRAKNFSKQTGQEVAAGFEVYTIKSNLGIENTHEWIYIKKDGSKIDVELTITQLKNSHGMVNGYIGIATDITDRKRQQKQIETLNKGLEQKVQEQTKELRMQLEQLQQKDKMLQEQAKLAAMGEMMSAIAHQWRQPLNALSINIQNLDDDYEDGLIDEVFLEKFIDKQTQMIGFMSKTIDDFRNFFKTDKQKTSFSIEGVIEKVYKILQAQMKNHNIEVLIEGDDFRVSGYQSEMQQVFLNLFGNAKDAIDKNSGSGTIRIKIESKNKTILVCDTGGGVKEELLEKIFEPYFTTKDPDKGTGIGLYISRTIVVSHMDGQMRAYNSDNGLCMEITLRGQDE